MFDTARQGTEEIFKSVADLGATIETNMDELYQLDINIKERLVTIESILLAICHKLEIPRTMAQYAIADQRYLLSSRYNVLRSPATEKDKTLPEA